MASNRESVEGAGCALGGCAIILFGIIVGGVGLVSAGFGVGIPVVPIGILIMIYGIWKLATSK